MYVAALGVDLDVAADVDEVFTLCEVAGLADAVDEPLDPGRSGVDLVVASQVWYRRRVALSSLRNWVMSRDSVRRRLMCSR